MLDKTLRARPLDEAEARGWLDANGRKSLRELGRAWGWHVSRVRRLLARLEPDTPLLCRDTPPDTPDTPGSNARPHDEPFDWADPNLIALAGSPAVAVYVGGHGHVVIRAQGVFPYEDDQLVLINPRDIWRLLDALRRVADGLRDERAR
jgi:hypothetical protein